MEIIFGGSFQSWHKWRVVAVGNDGGGRDTPTRLTALESLFRRATNLQPLHVANDVIKHDITLGPYFTQKAQPAHGPTRGMTTSEEGVEEKLQEGGRDKAPGTLGFRNKATRVRPERREPSERPL